MTSCFNTSQCKYCGCSCNGDVCPDCWDMFEADGCYGEDGGVEAED